MIVVLDYGAFVRRNLVFYEKEDVLTFRLYLKSLRLFKFRTTTWKSPCLLHCNHYITLSPLNHAEGGSVDCQSNKKERLLKEDNDITVSSCNRRF